MGRAGPPVDGKQACANGANHEAPECGSTWEFCVPPAAREPARPFGMKEWSGAEVAGSSDGRREGLGSSAPSAGASEVIIVVQHVDNATMAGERADSKVAAQNKPSRCQGLSRVNRGGGGRKALQRRYSETPPAC